MKQKAFTLAELLIALAILAVIVTFAIPKVLTAQVDQQNRSIIKELVGGVSGLTQTACLDNPPANIAGLATYIQDNLNTTQICASEAACGITTNTFPYTDGRSNSKWFKLTNGAFVHVGTGGVVDINIDANGSAPPNLYGQDRLRFYTTVQGTTWRTVNKPCRISIEDLATTSASSENPGNINLYNDLFTH